MKWYLLAWRRFAEFGGRSRRMEYWMFILINIVIYIVLYVAGAGFALAHQPVVIYIVLYVAGAGSALAHQRVVVGLMYILYFAYTLAALIPSLACAARRLHDTNKSAWWLLLGLVPIINLVLIVFLALDGTPGDNQYGPNPKAMQQPTVIG